MSVGRHGARRQPHPSSFSRKRGFGNSWRPFTVDAFKAVDQERVTADRLRRQASIGLQELRDRS